MIRRDKVEKPAERAASRPSLGQLKAWEQDEITQWILKQLCQAFPGYRQLLPVKTNEANLLLNYRVGCREVIQTIEKLVETGEI